MREHDETRDEEAIGGHRPWCSSIAPPWRNPARVLLVAAVAAALADAVVLVFGIGSLGSNGGSALHCVAFGLVAAVLACRAVAGGPRVSWSLVAGGAALTAVGAWMSLVDHREARLVVEATSNAARVALGLGAVMLLDRLPLRVDRSLRLDGVITGLSVGALGAAVWFDSVVERAPEPVVALLALTVPLVDLVIVAVILDGLVSRRIRPGLPVALLAVGAIAMTGADAAHLRAVVLGTATPDWVSMVWLVALTLIALAAAAPAAEGPTDRRVPRAGLSAVPIVCSAASLGVLGYGIQHHVDMIASLLALASVGLVIVVRTALTMRDLRRAAESHVLARTDELTGLANRRGFVEALDRLLTADAGPLSVTILDLNGFKDVNDSFGHHAGDELLRMVATRFGATIGAGAVLARLGGDEFGVVAPSRDAATATASADALRRALDAAFDIDGASVRVGASIGVSMHPTHGTGRDDLLRCADVAMYDAKRSHGGVAMYVPLTDFNSHEKLQLLEDLRKVIDERRLTLHYLPKLDLRSGRVVGSEALVRWRHPTRGLLLPDAFVPMAERAGLIPGITRAVIAQAIAFHAEQFPELAVSVNISHCDLVDDNLGDYIADLLEIYRFDAAQLTLEITEAALAQDPMRAAGALAALRALGVRVSIDDFGVGYSSNARLFELPVDEVKIDRSLVMAIEHDERALAVVRSTVQLASALGIETVAEGIESSAVLDAAAEVGVHFAQGYVISRPVPTDEYATYLARVEPPTGHAALGG